MNKELNLEVVPFIIVRALFANKKNTEYHGSLDVLAKWPELKDYYILTFQNNNRYDSINFEIGSKESNMLLEIVGLDPYSETFGMDVLGKKVNFVLVSGTNSNLLAIVKDDNFAFIKEHGTIYKKSDSVKPPLIISIQHEDEENNHLKYLKEEYGITEEELVNKIEQAIFDYNNGIKKTLK